MARSSRSTTRRVFYVRAAVVAALVTAAAIGGCRRGDAPTQAVQSRVGIGKSLRIVRGSHRNRPAEARFVQLANEISGFAGYYVESTTGQLVVYVKDSTRDSLQNFASAAAAVRSHIALDGLGMPLGQRPAVVRARRADFDFQALSDYRDIVSDSMLGTFPGVEMVDLDEAINRVSIAWHRTKRRSAPLFRID